MSWLQLRDRLVDDPIALMLAPNVKEGLRLLGLHNLCMGTCFSLVLPTIVFVVKHLGLDPSIWSGAAGSTFAVGCLVGFFSFWRLRAYLSIRSLLVLCNMVRILSGVCMMLLMVDGVGKYTGGMLVLLARALAGFSAMGNPVSMAWAGAALPKETRSSAIKWLTLTMVGGLAAGGPLGSLLVWITQTAGGSSFTSYTMVPGILTVLLSLAMLLRSMCVFTRGQRLEDLQALRPRSASMGSPIRKPLFALFLITTAFAWVARAPWDALLPVYMEQQYHINAGAMWLPMLLEGGSPFVGGLLYMLWQPFTRGHYHAGSTWNRSAIHVTAFKATALICTVGATLLLLRIEDLGRAPPLWRTLSGITLSGVPFSWVMLGTNAALAVEIPPEKQPLCSALVYAAAYCGAGLAPVLLSQLWSAPVHSFVGSSCTAATSGQAGVGLSALGSLEASGGMPFDACSANLVILIQTTFGFLCYVLLLFYPKSVLKGPESVAASSAYVMESINEEGAITKRRNARSSIYMVLSGEMWKRLQEPTGGNDTDNRPDCGSSDSRENSFVRDDGQGYRDDAYPSRRNSGAVVSFRDEGDEVPLAADVPSRRASCAERASLTSGQPATLDMVLGENVIEEPIAPSPSPPLPPE